MSRVLLAVFIFIACLEAKMAEIYTPKPDLIGDEKGRLELNFSWDVKKTGKYDPESGLALDEVWQRITAQDGEQLYYELMHGYHKAPLHHATKQIVKFIKKGDERWVVVENYNNAKFLGRRELCFWDDIGKDAEQAFDSGNIKGLYLGSVKFDARFFSDNNYFDNTNGKVRLKHYISARDGVRRQFYEHYEHDNGSLSSVSYDENSRLIWTQTFYENGKIKSYSHYVNGEYLKFDENGKMTGEK